MTGEVLLHTFVALLCSGCIACQSISHIPEIRSVHMCRKPGIRLVGHVIKIVHDVTALGCSKACLSATLCVSVNYSPKKRMCELSDAILSSFPSSGLPSQDFMYISTDNCDSVKYQTCKDQDCCMRDCGDLCGNISAKCPKGSNLVKSSTGRVLSIEGQRNQNGNTPGNEYIKAIGDQNTSSCAMANSTAGKAINWVVIFNRHVNVSTVALYTDQPKEKYTVYGFSRLPDFKVEMCTKWKDGPHHSNRWLFIKCDQPIYILHLAIQYNMLSTFHFPICEMAAFN